MAGSPYLAMTTAEFVWEPNLPEKIGWMTVPCAQALPPVPETGLLLILTDREKLPAPEPLLSWLEPLTGKLRGVALDFQRPVHREGVQILQALTAALPCPVAAAQAYARECGCPVFLHPCPHHVPLEEHIALWKDREIWLDLALDAETVTLTREGAVFASFPRFDCPSTGFREERLHCHYRAETGADFARFTLWRTSDDLQALMQEAKRLGITTFVGLWQEWNQEC